MTGIAELAADPSWLPEGYDAGRDVIRFARIGRISLSREAFLDARMEASISGRAEAPFAEIEKGLAKSSAPAFVFHTAFCCSTLLARALDVPGHALALKEPNILLDLANALRVHEPFRRDPSRFERVARLVFALLARPHSAGERIVIKPTNTASTLLPLALKNGAQCLLLYGGLRDFLVSILKKGEEGRAFIRQQFNIYALDGTGLGAIPQRQAMAFTDLQVTALVWRHQIEQFQRSLSADEKLASLEFRELLADPAATLKAAARHLRLDIPEQALEAAATGDTFVRDAKFSDRPYDVATRRQEESETEDRFGPELDLLQKWAKTLNLGVAAEIPLPRALSV